MNLDPQWCPELLSQSAPGSLSPWTSGLARQYISLLCEPPSWGFLSLQQKALSLIQFLSNPTSQKKPLITFYYELFQYYIYQYAYHFATWFILLSSIYELHPSTSLHMHPSQSFSCPYRILCRNVSWSMCFCPWSFMSCPFSASKDMGERPRQSLAYRSNYYVLPHSIPEIRPLLMQGKCTFKGTPKEVWANKSQLGTREGRRLVEDKLSQPGLVAEMLPGKHTGSADRKNRLCAEEGKLIADCSSHVNLVLPSPFPPSLLHPGRPASSRPSSVRASGDRDGVSWLSRTNHPAGGGSAALAGLGPGWHLLGRPLHPTPARRPAPPHIPSGPAPAPPTAWLHPPPRGPASYSLPGTPISGRGPSRPSLRCRGFFESVNKETKRPGTVHSKVRLLLEPDNQCGSANEILHLTFWGMEGSSNPKPQQRADAEDNAAPQPPRNCFWLELRLLAVPGCFPRWASWFQSLYRPQNGPA